jgi:ferredoxin
VRLSVDRDLCKGHAMCLRVGEDVVEIDAESTAVPLHDDEIPADLVEQAQQALRLCPEHAITLLQ